MCGHHFETKLEGNLRDGRAFLSPSLFRALLALLTHYYHREKLVERDLMTTQIITVSVERAGLIAIEVVRPSVLFTLSLTLFCTATLLPFLAFLLRVYARGAGHL